jgi:pimeloyl-ACP methyl ester carboxylesterase
MWDGFAEALARLGHRSVAIDLRGHGHSTKPDSGYDFATVTDDVAGVIRDVGWSRPVVVGQSYGGNVVVELAARHDDLVGGVVAVDGGTIQLQDRFDSWADAEHALRPPPLAGMASSRMIALLRSSHPDWPHSGIEGALANFEHLPDGTLRPWLTLERHLMILRELWGHRPAERLAEVTVPVMFVPADNGAVAWTHDKEASIATATLGLRVPHRTVWFRPADHDLHAQHPERLASVLHSALEEGFFA